MAIDGPLHQAKFFDGHVTLVVDENGSLEKGGIFDSSLEVKFPHEMGIFA